MSHFNVKELRYGFHDAITLLSFIGDLIMSLVHRIYRGVVTGIITSLLEIFTFIFDNLMTHITYNSSDA